MSREPEGARAARWRAARKRGEQAVLEGFHAVKHAVRFGAPLEELVTSDRAKLLGMADDLAPDVRPVLEGAEPISPEAFRRLLPYPPGSGVAALGRRAPWTLAEAVDAGTPGATVLLEHPSHLGNVGAAIRNAAGLGARAVILVGEMDPWHPDAIRSSAGLHYALPVVSVGHVPPTGPAAPWPPIIAVDPEGSPVATATLPGSAVLAFGTEREGVSAELKSRSSATVALPMRPGVSSLNLATSVGIALYEWQRR